MTVTVKFIIEWTVLSITGTDCTKCCGEVCNSPGSYSGGRGLKYCLCSLWILVVCFSLSTQMPG